MRPLTQDQIAEAAKVHVESCQRILQPYPDDHALVVELSSIWRDLDAYGRRSRENSLRYHRRLKSARVVDAGRRVAVLRIGS